MKPVELFNCVMTATQCDFSTSHLDSSYLKCKVTNWFAFVVLCDLSVECFGNFLEEVGRYINKYQGFILARQAVRWDPNKPVCIILTMNYIIAEFDSLLQNTWNVFSTATRIQQCETTRHNFFECTHAIQWHKIDHCTDCWRWTRIVSLTYALYAFDEVM